MEDPTATGSTLRPGVCAHDLCPVRRHHIRRPPGEAWPQFFGSPVCVQERDTREETSDCWPCASFPPQLITSPTSFPHFHRCWVITGKPGIVWHSTLTITR